MVGRRLIDLDFDAWLEHVFGHAVPFQGQAWYFAPDCDWWDPKPEQAVAHITRLFERPGRLLNTFADSQIAQGFWYLLHDASLSGLTAESVPLAQRTHAVRSMEIVFREIFAPRCAAALSHLNEGGDNPLNQICYMWWDIIPLPMARGDDEIGELDLAVLAVARRILILPNVACQEAALHGLGHATGPLRREIEGIIDAYLSANPGLRPALRSYAAAARSGCVQ